MKECCYIKTLVIHTKLKWVDIISLNPYPAKKDYANIQNIQKIM